MTCLRIQSSESRDGMRRNSNSYPSFSQRSAVVMRAGITTPSHTLPHLQTQLNPRTYLITTHNTMASRALSMPVRRLATSISSTPALSRRSFQSSARLLEVPAGVMPVRKPVGAFRGGYDCFSVTLSPSHTMASLPSTCQSSSSAIFDFGCRVHMMLTREQYPWIPLWSRAQRRSSVLLCH
jgi:hypothetical protein